MEPEVALLAVVLSLAGCMLGGACALVPGFHVNTLSLVLLSLFPALSSSLSSLAALFGADLSSPILFSVLLVSAATTHSFVDFVPSTFLGVPAEDTVLSVLPAHRLLRSGKGLEAIRHAASGSLCGALMSLLLVVPLELVLGPPSPLADLLDASVPLLLLGVVALLMATEKGHAAPRAYLDIREGAVMARGFIIARVPAPVHGSPGMISGRAVRSGPRSYALINPHGRWKVVAGTRALRGFVTVRGTWVVRRDRARGPLLAAATLSLSGLLGFVVMNARPPLAELIAGLGQDVLFPLLSGLFAFPALLSAMSSAPVPPQSQAADEATDLRPALTGTLAGFLAGWMPGITSTIGTVIGTAFTRRPEDEEQGTKSYIRMLSAVGTSSVVFSMMALALEGEGRTGVMLSLKEALGDEVGALSSLPGVPMALLLIAVLVASAAGYRLALSSGALLARKAAGRDLRRVNLVVLALLCALILLFNGLSGLVVAAVAALVGSLPPLVGVRRVHLTGCLLLPLLLFYFGLEEELAGLIWGASVSP